MPRRSGPSALELKRAPRYFRDALAAHPLQREHTMAPRCCERSCYPAGSASTPARRPPAGPEFEARPPRAAVATALQRRKFIEYGRREGEAFP